MYCAHKILYMECNNGIGDKKIICFTIKTLYFAQKKFYCVFHVLGNFHWENVLYLSLTLALDYVSDKILSNLIFPIEFWNISYFKVIYPSFGTVSQDILFYWVTLTTKFI